LSLIPLPIIFFQGACCAAVRYVEMNPVAAGLAVHPAEYRWSSAKAHLESTEDIFAAASPLGEMIPGFDNLKLTSKRVL
jgi:putative transposase